jgi:hypothetical protein
MMLGKNGGQHFVNEDPVVSYDCDTCDNRNGAASRRARSYRLKTVRNRLLLLNRGENTISLTWRFIPAPRTLPPGTKRVKVPLIAKMDVPTIECTRDSTPVARSRGLACKF